MNSKLLSNKIIIVTGGNGLLGKSIISEIISEGGIAVNFDLGDNGIGSETILCDITNSESIDNALILFQRKFNRVDGLINNAYPRTKDWGNKFEDILFDSWKENIDIQLNSHFYISQKISLMMSEAGRGSIVNMASVYGVVGPDFSVYKDTNMTMPAAYSAIKGGLINLTRYMASYLGNKGIRVNSVSPGGIFDNQNSTFVNNYSKKVPLGRMGVPGDISPTVIFLMSEKSNYITGQNIIVDGGWSCI